MMEICVNLLAIEMAEMFHCSCQTEVLYSIIVGLNFALNCYSINTVVVTG